MILARRSRLLPSRSAAARVSSVDWPLTCNTRARIRTRSDRSCKLITACSGIEAKKVSRSGTGCHIRFHHLFWIDDAIKFSLSDKAQLQGGSLECEVIIHDLHSDHGEGFTLGGVDLAWHDRRARLVFRDRQFGKSGARPARHQANVIADLVEGHC